LRINYPGAFYHVTCRGNERKNIFANDRVGALGVTHSKAVIKRHDLTCENKSLYSLFFNSSVNDLWLTRPRFQSVGVGAWSAPVTHQDQGNGVIPIRKPPPGRGLEGQIFTFDVRRKRRELLIRLPHLAGQYFSTSDWHELDFCRRRSCIMPEPSCCLRSFFSPSPAAPFRLYAGRRSFAVHQNSADVLKSVPSRTAVSPVMPPSPFMIAVIRFGKPCSCFVLVFGRIQSHVFPVTIRLS
jgi:hypothetical protein